MQSRDYRIAADAKGLTVLTYLRKRIGYSSTLLKKVKATGITLNGAAVTVRARLAEGDLLTVSFPSESGGRMVPIPLPLEILYEDGELLAVFKPSGIPTHPAKGTGVLTLANAVCAYLGPDCVFRAANRLDTDTAGIVLIAKTPLAASLVGEQMRRRKIEKCYLALVSGIPEPRFGTVDAPIEREREDSQRRVVREGGQEAVTEYRVLSTCGGNAVCEICPKTGRTHQIRVHMAHIGHPLVGDFLYGTETPSGYRLVCFSLSLRHPTSGKPLEITLPSPMRYVLPPPEAGDGQENPIKRGYAAPRFSRVSLEGGSFGSESDAK